MWLTSDFTTEAERPRNIRFKGLILMSVSFPEIWPENSDKFGFGIGVGDLSDWIERWERKVMTPTSVVGLDLLLLSSKYQL